MKDTDIIKALEYCNRNDNDDLNCEGCPYNRTEGSLCMDRMQEDALALINRQKAEIEVQERTIKNLQATVLEVNQYFDKKVAEAIKEFAERLKERFLNLEYRANTTRKTLPIGFVKDQMEWMMHEVSIETVDNLVKEKVGEME